MAVTANYSKTSPYFGTTLFGNFLDVIQYRDLPKDPADVVYQIDAVYENRPDLLANDLYSDSSLWWVFAVRNPNVLQDPIYDFRAGTIIYIPKKDVIITTLGL